MTGRPLETKKPRTSLDFVVGRNSSDRSRTCDLGLMNPALYHLSYAANVSFAG